MEGDRTEYYRQVMGSLPPMQQRILALDVALTGIPPERCVGQYHHQPPNVEKFLEAPGGHPIWYLSDGGYSRIVWDEHKGDVFLTSNSTSKVKANWEKAAPERKALEDYLNAELKRLVGESRPKVVVNTLLETDEDDQRVVDTVKGLPPEPDDTQYGAALRDLDSISAKVKQADALHGDLSRSLRHYLPTVSAEQGARISAHTQNLDSLLVQRRHKLAQIRYALQYRWALRKAGVKPEEVDHKFTSRVEKFGHPIKVVMTELALKDGRRVKIEPFEIPRELLKL